ncbi:MAG: hypothetical protein IPP96_12965 [Chitinophagaceae bacterium]|jgi:hypothetical protein|nr:hypothetical protein [Chitinophagaceae bacterium]
MNNFSLNPDMNIEVVARFIAKGSDAPLNGDNFEMRLFEKDLMEDDYLGRSPLDEDGVAKISFKHGDYKDFLNPEINPDLYFALYRGEALIFQSKVMRDLDLESMEKFKMGEGEVVDLGTFLV